MSNYETHLKAKKAETLLRMLTEDGASGPGQTPPVEHLEAVNNSETIEDAERVAVNHRNNDPPGKGAGVNK